MLIDSAQAQRYKYHLSFLEIFGVLVKTQSYMGGWRELCPPWGGGGGEATCLGFDERLHGFLGVFLFFTLSSGAL